MADADAVLLLGHGTGSSDLRQVLLQALMLMNSPQQRGRRAHAETPRRLRRTVRLTATVDTSLIGGAVVRAGDFVIDGSLRGRVERLANTMAGA